MYSKLSINIKHDVIAIGSVEQQYGSCNPTDLKTKNVQHVMPIHFSYSQKSWAFEFVNLEDIFSTLQIFRSHMHYISIIFPVFDAIYREKCPWQ